METSCDIVLNALYIFLSATIVFAQLVVTMPSLLRLLPFYKKAVYALDSLFRLDEEKEFPFPAEPVILKPEMVKLRVGYAKEGERGFRELLEAIKEQRPMPNIEAKTLGLAYGDIPIPTSMASPNFALFIGEIGISKPIYFDPWCSDDPSYIRAIFLDWIIKKSQTGIAKWTSIIVVIWIAIMTYKIYS